MSVQTVLIVSHDAGGSNLLAYWCQKWQSRVNFIYQLAGPALPIFAALDLNLGLDVNQAGNAPFPSPAAVDAVVTATGWQSDMEHQAIKWARQHDIPCASYLDHWVNYQARFVRDGVALYPDEIWAADRDAFKLAKDIFSLKNIKIRFMANQYFRELKRQLAENSEQADSILICLEPIRNGIRYAQVYPQLVRYLAGSGYQTNRVVIRDHPSGCDTGLEMLKDLLAPKFQVTISQQALWQDLACARAVVGYQSSVLAYACYLKITAISFFPVDKLEPILPHKNIEYFKHNMTIL